MDYWMIEESFNKGDSICYICKTSIVLHEDAIFHWAPFYMECLKNIWNGWITTLESDPVFFVMWIIKNWILGNIQFVVLIGQLSFYLDRDWKHDPVVEVLDDSENLPVLANEAEIPEVIVIDSDSKVLSIKSVFKNGEERMRVKR